MNQIHTQKSTRRSSRRRFAPAASNPAERGDAAHRVSQNDMPPLPGICWRYRISSAFVDLRLSGCQHTVYRHSEALQCTLLNAPQR